MLSDKGVLEKAKKVIRERHELFEALLEFERTGKLPRLTYKQRANFTIDHDLLIKFRSYCKKNGYNMSNKIEQLIRKELKKANY